MEEESASGIGTTRKTTLIRGVLSEHASPATRLLEKRRQMFEVQEALEQQKAEFERKEEAFREREEALKRRDLDLQENLIKFSKFLQDNDSKRARADKKTADEAKARTQKEREIEGLEDALQALREEKESVHEVLDTYMACQRYLQSVLEAADEYQEVGDLLTRHATLTATNADLQAHQLACDAAAEDARRALAATTKRGRDEQLRAANHVAALKAALERAEAAAAAQAARVDARVGVAARGMLEHGQVLMAADNIFGRCLQRSHVPHHQEQCPLRQLDVIAAFVSDLGAILKQHQPRARSAQP